MFQFYLSDPYFKYKLKKTELKKTELQNYKKFRYPQPLSTHPTVGFNTRDGVCLNESPVKATTYVDDRVDKGDYIY